MNFTRRAWPSSDIVVEGMLKVLCDSPRGLPEGFAMIPDQEEDDGHANQGLGIEDLVESQAETGRNAWISTLKSLLRLPWHRHKGHGQRDHRVNDVAVPDVQSSDDDQQEKGEHTIEVELVHHLLPSFYASNAVFTSVSSVKP